MAEAPLPVAAAMTLPLDACRYVLSNGSWSSHRTLSPNLPFSHLAADVGLPGERWRAVGSFQDRDAWWSRSVRLTPNGV